MILAEIINNIGQQFLDLQYGGQIDCFDPQSIFKKGHTIENYIKGVRAAAQQSFLVGEII